MLTQAAATPVTTRHITDFIIKLPKNKFYFKFLFKFLKKIKQML